ncbi:hypothetical protein [Xenorhabdus szentirmaii]|uniref:hypothetical protein n=1 Tax=Xenorhabdus szentirmaii TaxID=290112 RepID=UPI0019A2031B|nr:hypothetical protein [Xenorhabdus sp. CUL]MBD2791715.1 hypothetical protein [Xenorhabdus sp. CUL]
MGTMREELDFYMNEASPECLEGRREYIEVVLMNLLEKNLDGMKNHINHPKFTEIKAMHIEGIEFFTNAGFKRRILE